MSAQDRAELGLGCLAMAAMLRRLGWSGDLFERAAGEMRPATPSPVQDPTTPSPDTIVIPIVADGEENRDQGGKE